MKTKYLFLNSAILIVILFLLNSCFSDSEETENETEQEHVQPETEKLYYESSNEVSEFVRTPNQSGYLFFSSINPLYAEEKEARCLFTVLSEIVGFIDMKIGYGSYDQSYGSFLLSDMRIKLYTDAAFIDDLVGMVELVGKIKDTGNGDIITVKVRTDKLRTIWSRYNSHSMPSYAFSIEQHINEQGIPNWFLTPPEKEGYIFGTGVYSNVSDTSALIHYADVSAKAEIIKILGTKVSGELKDYIEDTFQFYSFLNKQLSVGRLPGMYVINRYYDKKSGRAYSLAVLKTK